MSACARPSLVSSPVSPVSNSLFSGVNSHPPSAGCFFFVQPALRLDCRRVRLLRPDAGFLQRPSSFPEESVRSCPYKVRQMFAYDPPILRRKLGRVLFFPASRTLSSPQTFFVFFIRPPHFLGPRFFEIDVMLEGFFPPTRCGRCPVVVSIVLGAFSCPVPSQFFFPSGFATSGLQVLR